MSLEEEIEFKIQQKDQKILELSLQNETLSNQISDFINEIGITFEQLTKFLDDKNNFSESNWIEVIKQKKELEDKLKRELENIRNPLAVKKTYKERKIGQNWIFVR